jgi:hypothetical protein
MKDPEFDEDSFAQLCQAPRHIYVDPTQAIAIYEGILANSSSLLCQTLAHFGLANNAFRGFIPWRDVRRHLKSAREGFKDLIERYPALSNHLFEFRRSHWPSAWYDNLPFST